MTARFTCTRGERKRPTSELQAALLAHRACVPRLLQWTDDAPSRLMLREVLAQHMALPANRDRFEAMMPALPAAYQNADGIVEFDRYLDWIRTPENWG